MRSNRMMTRGLAALVTLPAIGCADTVGPGPEDRLWQLDFTANRYEAQSGLGVSCRMVQILTDDPPPIAPPWTSTLVMEVQRQAGSASLPVSHMEDIAVAVTLDALGQDSVRLVVSGPYPVTVAGAAIAFAGGYSGAWTCDSTFPFADDPDLLEAGLDPGETIQGSWRLAPLPLPD